MKKHIFSLLIAVLILSAGAVAQENNTTKKFSEQPAVISLDLLGKTGYLVYTEEYYIKDSAGNLKLDNSKTFPVGNVNKSKVKLKITRPLDKSGKPYPQSMVKVTATLNNETILESWYKDKPKNSTKSDTDMNKNGNPQNSTKAIPGFEVLGVFVVIGLSAAYLRKDRGS